MLLYYHTSHFFYWLFYRLVLNLILSFFISVARSIRIWMRSLQLWWVWPTMRCPACSNPGTRFRRSSVNCTWSLRPWLIQVAIIEPIGCLWANYNRLLFPLCPSYWRTWPLPTKATRPVSMAWSTSRRCIWWLKQCAPFASVAHGV